MSSNKKSKKQIKSKQRKNSKITKGNKFSKELEEEFFKDMKMDIKDDFIDPMDNLFNFEDIEEKMFKNNFNLLLDKEDQKHPRKKGKKNYKDGTVFSRVYCSSYNNINGKEHEEKYKSESMKQMNNGRNISECKESYKNSDGVCKTSLQRGLDKKGQKVIREKNIKTGENKEHKIYKGMKENEVNTGNINSGNADVILKMISNNQDINRTTKINDSLINNISYLLPKSIKEKDSEISQEIGNSIISVNSIPKGIKIAPKPMIDVDISLNNDLKDELELQENKEGNSKFNIILSTNNSNTNLNNNILSRNKILNIGDTNILSTLSTNLDNSKYFLIKKNNGLITATKIGEDDKTKNEKDINLKIPVIEDKEKNKEKDIKDKKENNKKINKNVKNLNRIKYNSFNGCCEKKFRRKRRRSCNFITIIRDIFITIIVVSALAFYATIFIVG